MSQRDKSAIRYFPWFARDVALWPGIVYLIIAAFVGFINWRLALRVASGHAGRFGAMLVPTASGAQTGVWSTCLTITILFAIGGVVGIDVHRGYYRSLFSKPISPWWYYLQRYLFGAVIVLLAPCILGLSLKIALQGDTGITWQLMGTIAMAYLLTGSATLLFCIFRPEGWLFVFLAAAAQNMLAGMLRGAEMTKVDPPAIMLWAHRMLPPFDLLQPGGPPLQGGDLAHVLIYGVAMLAVALLLLRFRPLGTGGRS